MIESSGGISNMLHCICAIQVLFWFYIHQLWRWLQN